jgi:CMP-N-acetylneuraminic acid synthetase
MSNVLAIIQARGGSKGIPRKNIKELLGKPLIAWTIEAARAARLVTRVIVSTDDVEIAEVAKEWGAEVPFLRPAELASDEAKSIGLLTHALNWLSTNENYQTDIVVQLKPTNPLRRAETIDRCVELYKSSPGIDAVITVVKAPIHPLKTWKFDGEFLTPFVPEDVFGIKEASKTPRQKLPEAFGNNSCVHVINPKTILEKQSSIGTKVKGVILTREESINIDDPIDFLVAEILMRSKMSF